jgi:hypothetical protein
MWLSMIRRWAVAELGNAPIRREAASQSRRVVV